MISELKMDDPVSWHVMPSAKQQQIIAMPPPSGLPNRKIKKRKIIDEDDYVHILENIIERDYFPSIPKLKAQLEYLERNEKFDINHLKSIYSTLCTESDFMFPKLKVQISSEFDSYSVSACSNATEIDANMLTVDSFFRKYTSEDNESFEKIQKKNSEEFQRKFHWMFENMDHLFLTSSANVGNADPQQKNSKKAGMLMLYYLGNKVLTAEEREKMDRILAREDSAIYEASIQQRVNGSDPWQFRVRNQMFFTPELRDSYATCQVPLQQSMIKNSTVDSSNNANDSNNSSAYAVAIREDLKPGGNRSILPLPHNIGNSEQLVLTESATGYKPAVRHYRNSEQTAQQMTLYSKSADYDLRIDKVIQKSCTSLANQWFLAGDSTAMAPNTPSPFHTYSPLVYENLSTATTDSLGGFSSNVFQYADHDGGKANSRYVAMSPLVTQHDNVGSNNNAVQSTVEHAPVLSQLSDAQLLARYQALTALVDQSENNSVSHFKIQKVNQREMIGRLMDSSGRISDDSMIAAGLNRKGHKHSGQNSTARKHSPVSAIATPRSLLATPSVVGSSIVRSTTHSHSHKHFGSTYSVTNSRASTSRSVSSSGAYGQRKTLKDLTPAGQALARKLMKKRDTML